MQYLLDGASEEFFGIFAKNRCLWIGQLIEAEIEQSRHGGLKL